MTEQQCEPPEALREQRDAWCRRAKTLGEQADALRAERDAAVAARNEVVAAWHKFPEALELALGASPSAAVYKANALRWERDTAEQQLATLRAEVERLREAIAAAYREGWYDAFMGRATQSKPDDAYWNHSQARAALTPEAER